MIKKVLGVAASVCLAISATLMIVSAESKFPYEYTIENILARYQLFVENDAEITCHTVGAVAIGGTGEIDTWGDGQISPSYINHIKSAGNFNGGFWLTGEFASFKNTKVYYATADEGVDVSKFEMNPGYIEFDEAFANIQAESNQMAADAYIVTLNDCTFTEAEYEYDVLTLDLSKHSDFNVPCSVLDKVDYIDFVGVEGIDQLATQNYSVSITGVAMDDIELNFGYTAPGAQKGVRINGEPLANNNSFKNIAESKEDGQMNLSGMTLIWNFPDAASELTFSFLGGHVVAPNAHVSLVGGEARTSGHYEGNVIADSLFTNSEGHFFCYYDLSTVDWSSEEDSSSDESSESSSKEDSSSQADSSSKADSSRVNSQPNSSTATVTKGSTPSTGVIPKVGGGMLVVFLAAAGVVSVKNRKD